MMRIILVLFVALLAPVVGDGNFRDRFDRLSAGKSIIPWSFGTRMTKRSMPRGSLMGRLMSRATVRPVPDVYRAPTSVVPHSSAETTEVSREQSADEVSSQQARTAEDSAASALRTSRSPAAPSFTDWPEYLVATANYSADVYTPLSETVPGQKIVVSQQANGWLVRGTEDPNIGPTVDETSGKRLPRTNIISFRGLKNKSNSNRHCPAICYQAIDH
jgi:hypothetical protein